MDDREELARLKAEKARRDEGERSLIMASLVRIEKSQAVQGETVDHIREEQKRITKILYGDESDGKPGVVKRVDRLEGKVTLIWAAAVAGCTALAQTVWSWLSPHGK